MFSFSNANAQRKQSFIKRAYINTVSHYNYFFNANERVKEAQMNAALAHQDDFGGVVSLFPFSTQDILKGNTPQMDEAIKKCNHIITRRQTGKWVDDSWLLIGKSDFFKGDFFAALEAFEYVASTYKKTMIAYESEIWIVKTLIMLEKYDEAVAVSDIMMADKSFPKKFMKDLYLVSTEGLVMQGKYPLAYERIKKAMPDLKRSDYKYRKNFVAGQLAMLNNKPQEAIKYFNKVVKANSPYEFNFYARINMVRLYSQAPTHNVQKARNILSRMLKDDKNLDLMDQIYYELGVIDLKQGNSQSALNNFKQSLAHSKNKDLQSKVFLLVAELYFENTNYPFAQKYYDSAVQVLSPESTEFESISARHLVLTDLITNLVNISYQDSMLRLARDANFRKETLKKIKDEEQKRKEEEEYRNNNPFNNQTDPFAGTPGQISQAPQGTDSRFPFYNPQLKLKGQGDFERLWGNRELGDFWRIQSIAQTDNNDAITNKDKNQDSSSIDSSGSMQPVMMKMPSDISKEDEKYFALVPFDVQAQEAAEFSMGESYFKAGAIYRDKLNEVQKAKALLEQFLSKNLKNSYRENILYLLIKIYESEGNEPQVNRLKSMLNQEYPNSKFIQILQNPEQVSNERSSPEDLVNDLYELFYQKYKSKDFEGALRLYDTAKLKFNGNAYEGQFDYVYGLILSEQNRMKEYYSIMGNIAANYSGTPLGDLAADRVAAYEKLSGIDSAGVSTKKQYVPKSSKYAKGNENDEYHFIIKLAPNMDMNMVKIAFSDFNRDFRPDMGLQITTSFIEANTRVLIVTGFYHIKDVRNYIDDVVVNEALLKKIKANADRKEFLFITKQNFSTLLKEKKWTDYQEYFLKTYL